MSDPTSARDQLSTQTVTRPIPQPPAERIIQVRFNLRVMAAIGAGLLVLAAFLPWLDPAAQAILDDSRLTPIVQGWPSLLIGLIALGVLALPPSDSARWASLPAAALGLAAAVIAVAATLTASNTLADMLARFPTSDTGPLNVAGSGVFLTIVGGLLCIISGLGQPSASSAEARFELSTNQPAFSVLATTLVIVALVAGAVGWRLGSTRSGPPEENPTSFPADLLTTPVIDAQVTPLGVTPEPTLEEPVSTLPGEPSSTPEPILPTPTFIFITATPSPSPTASATPTSTPTATLPPSPLDQ